MTTDDLIATLSRQGPKKKFPSPTKVICIWIAAITTYIAMVLGYASLKSNILQRITTVFVGPQFITLVALIVVSAIAASYLALPDDNQKPYVRAMPLIGIGLLITILTKQLIVTLPSALVGCVSSAQLSCSVEILLFSIPPAAWMFWTIQKAAPIRYYWAAAMAGISSGSIGYLILLIIENSTSAIHLLIFHFLPVVGILITAILSGKWLLGRWIRTPGSRTK